MAAKGYDDSPPRNGTIFFYTVLTVVLLVAVKFLLDSYFAKVVDAEIEDKVLTQGMEEVQAQREQETATLEKGPLPIESAIKMMAKQGRAAMPEIAPQSGAGKPEVAGWSQLKREVAEPAPAAAPAVEGAPAVPAPQDAKTQGATN